MRKCVELLDQLISMINVSPQMNAARLLERLRHHAWHEQLCQLAGGDLGLDADKREEHLRELLTAIVLKTQSQQVEVLLNLSRERKLSEQERQRLNTLLKLKQHTL